MAEKNIITIQGKHLMAARRFAGTSEARPILMGVKLEAKGGHWKLVATDSFKLCVIEGRDKVAEPRTEIDIVLPPEAFAGLKASDRVTFAPGEAECKMTVFNKNAIERTVKLMEGNYPKYGQLLPSKKIPSGCYRYAPTLSATHLKPIMQAFEQVLGKDAGIEVAQHEGEKRKPTMMYGQDDDVRMTALLMPQRECGTSDNLGKPRPQGKDEKAMAELTVERDAAQANAEMWKAKALEAEKAGDAEKVKALEAEVEQLKKKAGRWVARANEEKAKRIEQEGDGKLQDKVKELEAELKKARKELDEVWKENATLKATQKPKAPAKDAPKPPKAPKPEEQPSEPQAASESADEVAEISLESMRQWCAGKDGLRAEQAGAGCVWVIGVPKGAEDLKAELKEMGFKHGSSKRFGRGYWAKPTAA